MAIKFEEKETPYFLYDLDKLAKKVDMIKKAFSSYKNFELYFAMKANSNKLLLKEIIKKNLGLHASSIYELNLALSLNCKKISYTAPFITKKILQIKRVHDFKININNKIDLTFFSNFDNVGLRINPLVGYAEKLETRAGGRYSQFGIPFNEIDFDALQQISGLHCHTSSDSFDQSIYIKQLKILLKLAKQNKKINSINIGGGIGVPIWKNEKPFNVSKFAKKIIKILNDFNEKNSTSILLELELGNYLVRECCVYVCKVMQIEEKFKKRYIFTDGTKHHLRGIAPDHAQYITKSKIKKNSVITGCTCQRGDILLKDKSVPLLKIGDLIFINNTGAYCSSQTDNFHLLPKPKEYFQ